MWRWNRLNKNDKNWKDEQSNKINYSEISSVLIEIECWTRIESIAERSIALNDTRKTLLTIVRCLTKVKMIDEKNENQTDKKRNLFSLITLITLTIGYISCRFLLRTSIIHSIHFGQWFGMWTKSVSPITQIFFPNTTSRRFEWI